MYKNMEGMPSSTYLERNNATTRRYGAVVVTSAEMLHSGKQEVRKCFASADANSRSMDGLLPRGRGVGRAFFLSQVTSHTSAPLLPVFQLFPAPTRLLARFAPNHRLPAVTHSILLLRHFLPQYYSLDICKQISQNLYALITAVVADRDEEVLRGLFRGQANGQGENVLRN